MLLRLFPKKQNYHSRPIGVWEALVPVAHQSRVAMQQQKQE
jgi:hypothetical protein